MTILKEKRHYSLTLYYTVLVINYIEISRTTRLFDLTNLVKETTKCYNLSISRI